MFTKFTALGAKGTYSSPVLVKVDTLEDAMGLDGAAVSAIDDID